MSHRKLSIVTVNLNNREGLRKTLQSIAAQDGFLLEVIVIDGGSTDGSLDVITEFAENGLVTFYKSEKDNGIYDAMNKGISYVNGEFTQFLNSGDSLNGNNAIKLLLDLISGQSADIYFADVIVSETGERIRYHDRVDRKFLFFNSLCHQSIVYKSDVFSRTGLYDKSYKILADREHVYRAFMDGFVFRHIDIPLVIWEKSGYSSKNIDTYVRETNRFRSKYYTISERFLIKLVRKMEILFS